ncbi:MAG: DUF4070 domain-containing protein [Verrucomicrobiota bacterium]
MACWLLFVTTLLRRPRQFSKAMELAIMGYHFRRVASDLSEESKPNRVTCRTLI